MIFLIITILMIVCSHIWNYKDEYAVAPTAIGFIGYTMLLIILVFGINRVVMEKTVPIQYEQLKNRIELVNETAGVMVYDATLYQEISDWNYDLNVCYEYKKNIFIGLYIPNSIYKVNTIEYK